MSTEQYCWKVGTKCLVKLARPGGCLIEHQGRPLEKLRWGFYKLLTLETKEREGYLV